ncbi:MaoC/PaaZ C-terminal domain-containing protein [Brevibacillus sp. Leaf182]|uniref:MaoC/PaaZ C-terminal domain-containing protein n=1 Tax=Brevibacillus sp. Leaf182 TaxID=1736290 RepID=UPI0006FD1F87|nr:MaoC/PaaZ C-terminal domain-containing protein [Brevibacillus sp. Leaf182]RAT94670.1 3-hydroxyacyl-ACP dehydratase [Brevibacillus sp. Leaf182]
MVTLQDLQKPSITHTQLVRYAGASGDFNPIHTVVPVGEQAGLGGVIAHGMLIMGFAGQALTQWFPRKDLRQFQVRFAKMTFPGEFLTVSGQITGEKEQDGEQHLLGEIVVRNKEEEVKLKGQFAVLKKQ